MEKCFDIQTVTCVLTEGVALVAVHEVLLGVAGGLVAGGGCAGARLVSLLQRHVDGNSAVASRCRCRGVMLVLVVVVMGRGGGTYWWQVDARVLLVTVWCHHAGVHCRCLGRMRSRDLRTNRLPLVHYIDVKKRFYVFLLVSRFYGF